MAYKNGYVITGSIGTGKSSVSKILRDLGYEVIDADEISHEILDESWLDIKCKFGGEFVLNDNNVIKVDRKKLGDLVFNDGSKLEILEKILHPKIKAEILRQSEILDNLGEPFFADIPLYFERQKYDAFDKIVVVYAPKDLQTKRIMKRNSLTRKEALVRINLQEDIESKRARATYVITNVSSVSELVSNVKKFIKGLK